VRRSVIGEGVRIAAGAQIEDAVVVRREIVREIERGTLSGDNLLVPIK
jgi:ADP-glucose pyrophosphorylase